jgi:hypothetical protein
VKKERNVFPEFWPIMVALAIAVVIAILSDPGAFPLGSR